MQRIFIILLCIAGCREPKPQATVAQLDTYITAHRLTTTVHSPDQQYHLELQAATAHCDSQSHEMVAHDIHATLTHRNRMHAQLTSPHATWHEATTTLHSNGPITLIHPYGHLHALRTSTVAPFKQAAIIRGPVVHCIDLS